MEPFPMTPEQSQPQAEVEKLARARTINLCLPGWLWDALPANAREEMRVVTMPEADNDPAAIHYITAVLENARADATREALEKAAQTALDTARCEWGEPCDCREEIAAFIRALAAHDTGKAE